MRVRTTPGAVPPGVTVNPTTGEVTFPPTYENSTATDQLFQVTLMTRVTTGALPTGQNNLTRTNTASFDSQESEGGAALPTVSASYAVSIRQPAPALAKSNNDPVPVGGDIVTYTVTATNPGSNRVPMHDSFITDCVPAGLTFQAYGANPGQAPTTGTGSNGCAAGTTRLVWALGDVAPGATITRTYTVLVPVGVVAGVTYTNTATLTGSTLNDGQTDPLAPINPNERGYAVSASSNVTIAGASITKTVTPTRATIGQRVTWTVTATVPANTVFFDGSLIDRAPAGIGNRQVVSFQCELLSSPTQPCTQVNTPTQLTPVPQPDGSILTGYLIGDIPAAPFPRVLVVNYSGVVLDQPVNVAGRLATNSAHTAWNLTNGSNPTSADFPYARQGNSASATVTIIEPNVGIAKTVDDTTPDPGQPFTYTLDVRNSNGPNTSTAYNVLVRDVVPTGVVVDPTSITVGRHDHRRRPGQRRRHDHLAGHHRGQWAATGRGRPADLLRAARAVDDPDRSRPDEHRCGAVICEPAQRRTQLHRTEYDGQGHAGLPPADDDQDGSRPGAGLHRQPVHLAGHGDQHRHGHSLRRRCDRHPPAGLGLRRRLRDDLGRGRPG